MLDHERDDLCHLWNLFVGKWPSEDLDKATTEAPNIHLFSDMEAWLEALRGHVSRGAPILLLQRVRQAFVHGLGLAKVAEFHAIF